MVSYTYPIQFVLVVRHLANSLRALEDRKAIPRRAKPIPVAGANVKVSIGRLNAQRQTNFFQPLQKIREDQGWRAPLDGGLVRP
jgi:hypothetical protein